MAGKSAEVAQAPGRLSQGGTLAIIDIGSNSVRLVVYENLARAPAQVFNEKEMAGLGRQVASTGRLAVDAMAKAISALVRFRILCEAMHVGSIRVIATAAARYASNGPEFIARAEEAIGQPIELISGDREAILSGLATSPISPGWSNGRMRSCSMRSMPSRRPAGPCSPMARWFWTN
jgi:exopolyphosphatase/guanosine-5'-triphosphate,3'-diphosphate pyrophosphatase